MVRSLVGHVSSHGNRCSRGPANIAQENEEECAPKCNRANARVVSAVCTVLGDAQSRTFKGCIDVAALAQPLFQLQTSAKINITQIKHPRKHISDEQVCCKVQVKLACWSVHMIVCIHAQKSDTKDLILPDPSDCS